MLQVIGWVMLWRRPSWGFLALYAAGVGVIAPLLDLLSPVTQEMLREHPGAVAAIALILSGLLNALAFAAIGSIVVLARGGKIERNPSPGEIDEMLARVRAGEPRSGR